jgi:hypothetical protein
MMSQQLVNGKKRQSQSQLTSFFKPPPGSLTKKARVETIVGGRILSYQCGYCGEHFSAQGIKNLELKHVANSDARDVTHQKRFGKVKVKNNGHKPVAMRDETIHSDDKDKGDDDEGPWQLMTRDGTIILDDDEEDKEDDKVMIVDEYGNTHEDVCPEADTNVAPDSSRAQNMVLAHCIEILDYFHSREKSGAVYPKSDTVKWVLGEARFNHPKYTRAALNKLLKAENDIRSAPGMPSICGGWL